MSPSKTYFPLFKVICWDFRPRIVLIPAVSWPNMSLMKTIGYVCVSIDKLADRGVSLEASRRLRRRLALLSRLHKLHPVIVQTSDSRLIRRSTFERTELVSSGEYLTIGLSLSLGSNSTET
jgi:hypothetical protein